jgi:hypothetical protein
MNSKLLEQIKRLAELAYRDHDECDDPWYSCTKAANGISHNGWEKGTCNCGADEHNAEVDALIKEIMTGQEET